MRKEFPVLHTYNKINEKIIKTIYNISTIKNKKKKNREETKHQQPNPTQRPEERFKRPTTTINNQVVVVSCFVDVLCFYSSVVSCIVVAIAGWLENKKNIYEKKN